MLVFLLVVAFSPNQQPTKQPQPFKLGSFEHVDRYRNKKSEANRQAAKIERRRADYF
jgi:hypothetical protein